MLFFRFQCCSRVPCSSWEKEGFLEIGGLGFRVASLLAVYRGPRVEERKPGALEFIGRWASAMWEVMQASLESCTLLLEGSPTEPWNLVRAGHAQKRIAVRQRRYFLLALVPIRRTVGLPGG